MKTPNIDKVLEEVEELKTADQLLEEVLDRTRSLRQQAEA